MRIAVYTRQWRSGTGLFAQQLAEGIAEAGAKVSFVSPATEDEAFAARNPSMAQLRLPRERLTGSRSRRALSSAARIAATLPALFRARMSSRVFVVTIPEPPAFGVPMLALLRLSGGRIIYVVHDPVPHAWRFPARLVWLERALLAWSYALATSLVVLSETSRQALLGAYPIDPARVHVIEHGVFVRGTPVPPPGRGRLLLFGALRRNKGIAQAIGGVVLARQRGADVKLLIAGGAPREEAAYWRECEALARAHPEAVELRIGYVEDSALDSLIRESNAFLMPYDAFFSQSGVATLAASNARPVIATRAGGIGDLADDGLPMIEVPAPPTADGVADAIERFLGVPAADWWTRGLAYREHMLAQRGWPVIGRAYLRLAETLAR